MSEPKLTKFALVRPLGTSFRYPVSEAAPEFSRHGAGHGNLLYRGPKTVSVKRRAKSSDTRVERDNCLVFPVSAMQTLDRRISASSDQLDTLKKQKQRQRPFRTRSSSRLSYERKFDTPPTPEVDFKFPAYYQKTPLAAIKDTPPPPPPAARGGGESVTKTPFEIFLEDDGPYSRKLYGPVTPKSSLLDRSRERQSQKTFCHSKLVGGLNKLRREKLVYTPADNFREKLQEDVPRPVRKGLLWQQKDKFFSRWKERFFVLTDDYLQCFKKENSRISEMGSFLSRFKLVEVEEVCLLTKKGYLTIALTHARDGRVLLRRHEGIRDWFSMIKAKVLECKAKQVQQDINSNNLNVEAWLLARKSLAGGSGTPRATPYMAHHKRVNAEVAAEEEGGDKKQSQPRGINRLSMVADLLQNETVTSVLVSKRKEKGGEDSGLESGHTSMNTASDTQSDSHSASGSAAGDSLRPDSRTPDLARTSTSQAAARHQHAADFDTFNMKTYQRRHQSRYTNLPVTIV